ncbi:hypothetical protein HK098_005478 [Nowakowskiella sp. JEL0407]|nr:hypothetical protein HK098_005478 [Nowakowskiella sp. JEL0407]
MDYSKTEHTENIPQSFSSHFSNDQFASSPCFGGFAKFSEHQLIASESIATGSFEPVAWCYRFNENVVEVRSTKANEPVIACLDSQLLAVHSGASLITIMQVAHGRIRSTDYIVVAGEDEITKNLFIFFFDPLSLRIYCKACPITKKSEVVCMNFSPEFKGVSKLLNALVLALKDGRIVIARVILTLNGPSLIDWTQQKLPPNEIATTIYTFVDSHHSTFVTVFVGTNLGSVTGIKVPENQYNKIFVIPSTNPVPVTCLDFDGPDNSRKFLGLLYIGYGNMKGKNTSTPTRVYTVDVRVEMKEVPKEIKLHPYTHCSFSDVAKICIRKHGAKHNAIIIHKQTINDNTRYAISVIALSAGKSRIVQEPIEMATEGSLQILDAVSIGTELVVMFTDKIAGYDVTYDEGVKHLLEIPRFSDWFDDKSFGQVLQSNENIPKIRKEKVDELFIDFLLGFAGLDGQSKYPPDNTTQLSLLFADIMESELEILQKHCIIYYLLRDYSKSKIYDLYGKTYFLPTNFRLLMDGYWNMDHGFTEIGVQQLTNTTVEPDFVDNIFMVLLVRKSYQSLLQILSTTQYASGLQIAHGEAKIDEHRIWIEMLLKNGDVMDAYLYQRKHVSDYKILVLKRIFDACFMPGSDPKNIKKLLTLPYSSTEEQFLIQYCTMLDVIAAQDFLMMYYIHHSRFIDAIKTYEKYFVGIKRDEKSAQRDAIVESVRMMLPDIVVMKLHKNVNENISAQLDAENQLHPLSTSQVTKLQQDPIVYQKTLLNAAEKRRDVIEPPRVVPTYSISEIDAEENDYFKKHADMVEAMGLTRAALGKKKLEYASDKMKQPHTYQQTAFDRVRNSHPLSPFSKNVKSPVLSTANFRRESFLSQVMQTYPTVPLKMDKVAKPDEQAMDVDVIEIIDDNDGGELTESEQQTGSLNVSKSMESINQPLDLSQSLSAMISGRSSTESLSRSPFADILSSPKPAFAATAPPLVNLSPFSPPHVVAAAKRSAAAAMLRGKTETTKPADMNVSRPVPETAKHAEQSNVGEKVERRLRNTPARIKRNISDRSDEDADEKLHASETATKPEVKAKAVKKVASKVATGGVSKTRSTAGGDGGARKVRSTAKKDEPMTLDELTVPATRSRTVAKGTVETKGKAPVRQTRRK